MITEIEYELQKQMEKMEIIKKSLSDVILPEKYEFHFGEEPYFNVTIIENYKILWFFPMTTEIANVYGNEKQIFISFEDVKDFKILKQSLDNCEAKIKVVIDGGYY